MLRLPLWTLTALLVPAAVAVAADVAGRPVGDPARGVQVYERCAGCHSLDSNRVGPAHRGVVGRPAGAVIGYRYSKALETSGIVWDKENLDQWLANPRKFVPGSRMGFRLSNPQDRADVIAYLKEAGEETE